MPDICPTPGRSCPSNCHVLPHCCVGPGPGILCIQRGMLRMLCFLEHVRCCACCACRRACPLCWLLWQLLHLSSRSCLILSLLTPYSSLSSSSSFLAQWCFPSSCFLLLLSLVADCFLLEAAAWAMLRAMLSAFVINARLCMLLTALPAQWANRLVDKRSKV